MGIGHGEGLRGAFGGGGGGWGAAAKACDSCKSAAAALFCRADSAFLCLGCDAKIHCANKLASRHERVWMCEVCEHAPAAVTCKADAAALCVSCDADIHSANPLARRHDRVPVEPFFDPADSLVRSSASAAAAAASLAFFSGGACDDDAPDDGACRRHDDVDPSPWIITSANFAPKLVDPPAVADVKAAGAELFYSEMDSFLDFDYSNPIHPSSGTDSVVPVKIKPISPSPVINNPDNCFDIEFCRSKLSSFAYPTQCLSHSVSSSSLDVGVVPDGSSASELSYAFGRSVSRAGSDPMQSGPASSSAPATQLCGLDREARVLRYREKRKNRKFEKTIRYASRKAYAETRPRIKGRFAKRTEIELENDNENDVVDHIYGSAFLADTQYGVVPTF